MLLKDIQKLVLVAKGGKITLPLVMVLLLLLPNKAKTQPSSALRVLTDKVVANYVNAQNINYGIAIGIIDGKETYQYYYGKTSDTLLQLPDSNSVFLLGSLSKVVTTSLMMSMVNEKILQPTDSITHFLPDSVWQHNPFLQTISLQKLASHTALLPKNPYNLPQTIVQPDNLYGNYQLEDLYRFLQSYRPTSGIFKKQSKKLFVYSHTGIGLLGHLLENASGLHFDQLIEQYLGKYCGGLPNTGARLQPAKLPYLLPGHTINGKLAPQTTFASMYASEGLYSTLPDMLRFVRACMTKKMFEPALEPHYNTQLPDVKVGWGWYVIMNGKRQPVIYTHSGKSGGYSNYLAFEKEKRVAVVVLSNSDNRIDRLGIDLLDILLR